MGTTPFEALYGKQCHTPLCWNEVGYKELCGPELIHDTNEKIKVVTDRLNAAQNRIHNVFHVSMLRKYIVDPSHVLQEQPISLQKNLTYEEEPVQILDRKEQVLRNKKIPLVKVLLRSHQVEEATWELEEQMRQQYPYLFD
ncbi:hypothetical protein ACLB2K_004601 [Fragaria x ananassa]